MQAKCKDAGFDLTIHRRREEGDLNGAKRLFAVFPNSRSIVHHCEGRVLSIDGVSYIGAELESVHSEITFWAN